MSNNENTQLTPAEGYDPKKRMIFSSPEKGSVPDSKPKIEFYRISISSRNEDGSCGELVIPTADRLFSFGVSESISQETGKVTGYTFPICLWNKEEPTREEKIWVDTFEKIVNTCIDYILEIKEEIDAESLSRETLTALKGGLDPLYWKKDKVTDEKTGKQKTVKLTDQGPTLYAKLIYSKKNDKFRTQFFDTNDEPLNPLDLMGKYCYTKAAIKVESIFVSGTGKISLQVKLYEAVVELANTGMKRLLARPKPKSLVLSSNNERSTPAALDDSEDEDGSDIGVDDAKEEVKKPPAKPPARRNVKLVAKK